MVKAFGESREHSTRKLHSSVKTGTQQTILQPKRRSRSLAGLLTDVRTERAELVSHL